MAKTRAPEGTRHGLAWAAIAYCGGLALNADRVPSWVPLIGLLFALWRWMAATRSLRLPATWARSLVALVLVAGVLVRYHTLNGLTAGTALLILMGAVKLLETRTQRDQFIVVGASVFLLLAACLDRQSLIRAPLYLAQAWLCCTALAAVAYLPTGSAASAVPTVGFDNRAAMVLAARSLLLALPLALLLFAFFPRLPGAFWAIPHSSEAVTGLSDSMSPGSISELTSSYDVAFRAHFEGTLPPPEQRYWRGPVLHEFDGYTWRRSGLSLMPLQPLRYLGEGYRYRISLEPSQQRWWFSLDTPTGSPASKVFFTYDYELVSAEPVTEATSYTLVSHTETRATGELPDAARRYETTLTGARNPQSRALAMKLRGESGTDAAFVVSVLSYFRTNRFQYTLTPPLLGRDSIDDFLFRTRLGFCGHYASAFVTLMRAGGVPARVVTGYLGGEWNPIGRYFLVHQSDAHSWAEVWLEGRGWTRIDPTAVVEPARLRRGILDILPNAVSAPARFVWSNHWISSILQRWDALNTWWNDRVVQFNYEDQLRLLRRLGFDSPGAAQLGWAFGAGLVGWLLWVAWQIGRSAPPARPDRLAKSYERLCRKMRKAGVGRQPHEGPLVFASEISRLRPDLLAHVQPLLLEYARLRYGPMSAADHAGDVREFQRQVSRLTVSARASGTPRRSQTGS